MRNLFCLTVTFISIKFGICNLKKSGFGSPYRGKYTGINSEGFPRVSPWNYFSQNCVVDLLWEKSELAHQLGINKRGKIKGVGKINTKESDINIWFLWMQSDII